jgi:hypothetical protein
MNPILDTAVAPPDPSRTLGRPLELDGGQA